MSKYSAFDRQTHEDALEDEKSTEASHRALQQLISGGAPSAPTMAPPAPPVAAVSPLSALPKAITSHPHFPKLLGALTAHLTARKARL